MRISDFIPGASSALVTQQPTHQNLVEDVAYDDNFIEDEEWVCGCSTDSPEYTKMKRYMSRLKIANPDLYRRICKFE